MTDVQKQEGQSCSDNNANFDESKDHVQKEEKEIVVVGRNDGPVWMKGLNELETMWMMNTNCKNGSDKSKKQQSPTSSSTITESTSTSIKSATETSTGSSSNNRDVIRRWLMNVTDENGQSLVLDNGRCNTKLMDQLICHLTKDDYGKQQKERRQQHHHRDRTFQKEETEKNDVDDDDVEKTTVTTTTTSSSSSVSPFSFQKLQYIEFQICTIIELWLLYGNNFLDRFVRISIKRQSIRTKHKRKKKKRKRNHNPKEKIDTSTTTSSSSSSSYQLLNDAMNTSNDKESIFYEYLVRLISKAAFELPATVLLCDFLTEHCFDQNVWDESPNLVQYVVDSFEIKNPFLFNTDDDDIEWNALFSWTTSTSTTNQETQQQEEQNANKATMGAINDNKKKKKKKKQKEVVVVSRRLPPPKRTSFRGSHFNGKLRDISKILNSTTNNNNNNATTKKTMTTMIKTATSITVPKPKQRIIAKLSSSSMPNEEGNHQNVENEQKGSSRLLTKDGTSMENNNATTIRQKHYKTLIHRPSSGKGIFSKHVSTSTTNNNCRIQQEGNEKISNSTATAFTTKSTIGNVHSENLINDEDVSSKYCQTNYHKNKKRPRTLKLLLAETPTTQQQQEQEKSNDDNGTPQLSFPSKEEGLQLKIPQKNAVPTKAIQQQQDQQQQQSPSSPRHGLLLFSGNEQQEQQLTPIKNIKRNSIIIAETPAKNTSVTVVAETPERESDQQHSKKNQQKKKIIECTPPHPSMTRTTSTTSSVAPARKATRLFFSPKPTTSVSINKKNQTNKPRMKKLKMTHHASSSSLSSIASTVTIATSNTVRDQFYIDEDCTGKNENDNDLTGKEKGSKIKKKLPLQPMERKNRQHQKNVVLLRQGQQHEEPRHRLSSRVTKLRNNNHENGQENDTMFAYNRRGNHRRHQNDMEISTSLPKKLKSIGTNDIDDDDDDDSVTTNNRFYHQHQQQRKNGMRMKRRRLFGNPTTSTTGSSTGTTAETSSTSSSRRILMGEIKAVNTTKKRKNSIKHHDNNEKNVDEDHHHDHHRRHEQSNDKETVAAVALARAYLRRRSSSSSSTG